MASFTFTVEGQHLRETEHRIVVSGSVRYLSAEFTFSDDWGDIPKYSFWTKGSVTHKIMLTDNKISPDENIYLTDGDWLVSVMGEDVEGEEIKKRITTNEVYVHVELNGPTEGDPFEDITPSIGEQIIGMANKSAEDAENSANEAARSASDAALHRNEAQQAEDQAEASAKSASKSAQDAYDSAEDAKKAVEDLPEKVEEYIDSHKEELKGEPGYTPQKGIDYFDGEPGYTPRKGVDYFDGYTPIKGIDYFDGEPGEPGPAYDDTKIKKEVSELSAGLAKKADKSELDEKVGFTDYASQTKAGAIKVNRGMGVLPDGSVFCQEVTKTVYPTFTNSGFISKATLENVLAERLKEPQFELIEDITLAEATTVIDRNAEPNGTPYSFKRIHIILDIEPSTEGSNVIYGTANGILAFYVSNAITNTKRVGYIDVVDNNGFLDGIGQSGATKYYTTGVANTSYVECGIVLTTPDIKRIQINTNGVKIPSGSNIKIYAIRA